MGAFLLFLRAHALGATIAAAIAFVLATIAVQHAEIGHLKAKVAAAKAENTALTASNKKLVAAIQDQNAAIYATVAEMNRRQKAAADALAHAKQGAAVWTARALKLASYKGVGDECQAMRALLADYVSGAQP